MNRTQKSVPIATGASSGIGLGITLALFKRGSDVIGTSRTISKSKGLNASADCRHYDVATASLIENWIDETESRTWFCQKLNTIPNPQN